MTQPVGAGWLTVWPAGVAMPLVSTLNFVSGETVANAALVPLGAGGAISVQPFATTHLVIDVNGYFADVEELGNGNTALGASALASNTTGGGNTAVGAFAGVSVTGSNNIHIGNVGTNTDTARILMGPQTPIRPPSSPASSAI